VDSLTTAQVLPISGCTAVFVHQRDGRMSLELLAPDGQLLAVFSDSTVDNGLLRGAWHGVRDQDGIRRGWSLAVGHCAEHDGVTVHFGSRRMLTGSGTTLSLDPVRHGIFWITEANDSFTHVTATSGARSDRTRLTRVRSQEVLP
jgi:hypothetical protein